jgi:multisubunit Na+/H+ antiporter MnhG subunit
MVELTHGGTWLNWKSLNRTDRNWAILSFAASTIAALPIGAAAGAWSYALGHRVGSGGKGGDAHDRAAAALLASDVFSYAMLASALFAVVSAFAWWRFSRNQDEMFNRIQNYALAQSGGWTMAFVSLWWILWFGGWLPELSLTAIVLFAFALITGFWFYAVRKWL